MNLYLDASVLVPLFVEEGRTGDAHRKIEGNSLIVSNFAMAEFSSGIARRVRMNEISEPDALSLFETFDTWVARAAHRELLTAGDVFTAMGFVRQVHLALRTPDAINVAIAQRCRASIFTFDTTQAEAARLLGLEIE